MLELDLNDLARRGAIARLAELQAEQAAILKAFPDLRSGVRASYTDDGVTMLAGRKRRRRGMSAAQRKAVSVRMKAYWATQRKSAKRQ